MALSSWHSRMPYSNGIERQSNGDYVEYAIWNRTTNVLSPSRYQTHDAAMDQLREVVNELPQKLTTLIRRDMEVVKVITRIVVEEAIEGANTT